MSQTQQISPCIHNGTIQITYEHKGKIANKLACKNCVHFIKSSRTFKLISKSPLSDISKEVSQN